MPTIQVLPHEVRQGDRITINAKVEFTGHPFDLNGRRAIALYYDTDAFDMQSHYVDPDQPLTVDRPDPDADLIEAMHEAFMGEFAARGYQLVEAANGDRRAALRAALAVIRQFPAGA